MQVRDGRTQVKKGTHLAEGAGGHFVYEAENMEAASRADSCGPVGRRCRDPPGRKVLVTKVESAMPSEKAAMKEA